MYLESSGDCKNINNREPNRREGEIALGLVSVYWVKLPPKWKNKIYSGKMNVSSGEKLSLKWNEHESNLRRSVIDCHRNNEFCDVTLLSEDLAHVPAHKLILSGSSGFFQAIFRKFPSESHPLIYLKGVKQRDLNDILSFIYSGEAGVRQEDLNNFLEVASELKIKGLTQDNPGSSNKSTKVPSSQSKRTKVFLNKVQNEYKTSDQHNEIQEEEIKSIPERVETSYDSSDSSEEKQRKELKKFSCIKSVGNGYSLAWRCQLCKKLFSSKKVAVGHIETEHEN